MSHKVDQRVFRIKRISDWKSRGDYQKNFPQYLEEDFRIRQFIKKSFPSGTVESVEIEREPSQIKIIINTPRPGLIIGRRGEGARKLQADIINILKEIDQSENSQGFKREIKIEIQEVREPWASAVLVAEWIALQIEKRLPYRRALKMALQKIMACKQVKGAKVQVAGRLNGLEIARTEWLKQGELPRTNLRADIDYGFAEAFCTYGVIGVKVWIYKGEKFED